MAHAAGILHRDIKPANILLTPTGSVKVADFGIAKSAATPATMTGQIVGTLAYLSPDRIAGRPASMADDLYAVGAVGYEALSGRKPFPQENLVELLLMLDAARGASAAQITAVIPHYAYARSDKKDAPRISIGGRLVADLIAAAGADRVMTMALHAPQVHGFFGVPVDHLTAIGELADHFRSSDLSNAVIVSPDLGADLPEVLAALRPALQEIVCCDSVVTPR